MNEEPATQIAGTAAVGAQPAPVSTPPPPEREQQGPQARVAAVVQEKPEVVVGAAFAGGFVFAMILRRVAG